MKAQDSCMFYLYAYAYLLLATQYFVELIFHSFLPSLLLK